MNDKTEAVVFEAALVDSLRVRRGQRGESQEDVAAAAREVGLDWTRATVANIEAGKRHLSPGEFVALPLVYGERLVDLLPQEPTTLGGTLVAKPEDVEALLCKGRGVRLRLAERARVPTGVHAQGEAERHAAKRLGLEPARVARVAVRLWGHGLTQERDRRLADEYDEADTPTQRRSQRGHVTRGLLEELRNAPEDEEE